jgi:transposase-like protein
MRNILAHIPQRDKKSFAAELKGIWLAPSAEIARKRATDFEVQAEKRVHSKMILWQAPFGKNKTVWKKLPRMGNLF